MARKPAAPPPPGGAESGESGDRETVAARGRSDPPERFGPLAVARMAKDDGRALIIYSHEEHEDYVEHDPT
jgi:hypothetical protein